MPAYLGPGSHLSSSSPPTSARLSCSIDNTDDKKRELPFTEEIPRQQSHGY